MSVARGLKVVGYFDCPGGGQVVVRDRIAYVGHVKPPNGTTHHRCERPGESAQARRNQGARRHAVAQGARRERHHAGQPGDLSDRPQGSGLSRRARSVRRQPSPSAAQAHRDSWPTRGMHRFTFDGRYVYGSPEIRRLSRQRRRHHRFQESGQARKKSAAGGCRDNGPPAARSRPGRAPTTAAIIRCASATGSMSAIGMAASSSSTSTT